MSVLVDSTLLSNFAAVGRLDLLESALEAAYIAGAVRDEIQRATPSYPFLAAVEQLLTSPPPRWLRVVAIEHAEERETLRSLPRALHPGEAESLAIARRRRWLLLTDDAKARRDAVRLGVEVSGTLGVLAGLIDHGDLTLEQANSLLRRMIELANYRSPIERLD